MDLKVEAYAFILCFRLPAATWWGYLYHICIMVVRLMSGKRKSAAPSENNERWKDVVMELERELRQVISAPLLQIRTFKQLFFLFFLLSYILQTNGQF